MSKELTDLKLWVDAFKMECFKGESEDDLEKRVDEILFLKQNKHKHHNSFSRMGRIDARINQLRVGKYFAPYESFINMFEN